MKITSEPDNTPRTIVVYGYDKDGKRVSETITLVGSEPVETKAVMYPPTKASDPAWPGIKAWFNDCYDNL